MPGYSVNVQVGMVKAMVPAPARKVKRKFYGSVEFLRQREDPGLGTPRVPRDRGRRFGTG